MSPSERDVRRAAAKILHLASPDPTSRADLSALHRFVHWARRNPLLRRVRDLQMAADPAGILNVGMGMGSGDRERQQQMEANLQIAMTLRDVTLFLLVPRDETRQLVARLGDLDLKSTAKMEEWVRIERELVEEGWYEGVEVERGMSRQALDCWLYPEEWTPEGKRRFLVPRTVRV
jgi:inositol-pentakisphosphate 2-kinase